jgi:hypothetical protein
MTQSPDFGLIKVLVLLPLLLLVLLGVAALVATLLALARSKNGLGLAVVVGLAMAAFAGLLLMASLFLAYKGRQVAYDGIPAEALNVVETMPDVQWTHEASYGAMRRVTWSIMPLAVLPLMAIAVIFAAVLIGRHNARNAPEKRGAFAGQERSVANTELQDYTKNHGGYRWWPALLLVPLIGLLLLISIRVQQPYRIVNGTDLPLSARTSARTELGASARAHFAQADIHALMDRADGPRIALEQVAIAETSSTESIDRVGAAQDSDPNTLTADEVAVAKVSLSADGDSEKDQEQPENETEKTTAAADAAENKAGDGRSNTSPTLDEEFGSELERMEKGSKTRPEWLKQKPQSVGDSWQEVIVTDEYATESECRRATDILLLLKTYERALSLAGYPTVDTSLPSLTFHNGMIKADGIVIFDRNNSQQWLDPRLRQLNQVGIGLDFVRRELIADQHVEEVERERTFDSMYKLYTRIEFSPRADAELRRHWAVYERQQRFAVVGVGAGSILGLLGMAYGLLKVDTLTKGYYSKWLFLGVPAAIIGGTFLFSLFL